jgi:hypothetical protein
VTHSTSNRRAEQKLNTYSELNFMISNGEKILFPILDSYCNVSLIWDTRICEVFHPVPHGFQYVKAFLLQATNKTNNMKSVAFIYIYLIY